MIGSFFFWRNLIRKVLIRGYSKEWGDVMYKIELRESFCFEWDLFFSFYLLGFRIIESKYVILGRKVEDFFLEKLFREKIFMYRCLRIF